MSAAVREIAVRGPWSLAMSRRFWEGFTPGKLPMQQGEQLDAVFLVEGDWSTATARIEQESGAARVSLEGDGDLDLAAEQVARFLSIDVDGSEWPTVAERDPVIADVQRALPGFRPCGFFSAYEAAAWSVLSQRIRMTQAAAIKQRLTDEFGRGGAFPAPEVLHGQDLGLPGRKGKYLDAVCAAAMEGVLDDAAIRSMDAAAAMDHVQQITGIGPFAAGLIVIRGANHPDAIPRHEPRLDTEVQRRYGADATLGVVSEAWRPFRTWAAVGLRALAPTSAA